MHLLTPLVLTLSSALTLAFPTESPALAARQSCDVQCGSICYSLDQVTAAVSAGYSYYSQDDTAGSSTYPHTYNNYEGFDFPVSGPYQEFPLKTSGPYSGGSPGADRVVFNTQGDLAGEITHSGASGNDFVACSGS